MSEPLIKDTPKERHYDLKCSFCSEERVNNLSTEDKMTFPLLGGSTVYSKTINQATYSSLFCRSQFDNLLLLLHILVHHFLVSLFGNLLFLHSLVHHFLVSHAALQLFKGLLQLPD